MTRLLLGTLMMSTLAMGCAHHPAVVAENAPPVAGPMQKASPEFVAESSVRGTCRGDSDCALGDICHPELNRCVSSYPSPRMLRIQLSGSGVDDCRLVNVYFAYKSTELVPEAQRWLAYDARCLKARDAKVLILQGHADLRGTSRYNRKLSVARGQAVRQVLLQSGVDVPVVVRGYGDSRPLRTGRSERAYAYNRRVELVTQ